MYSIQKDMEELHRQIRNGMIQRAYRSLIFYMMGLRTDFKSKYPDFSVSALYQGYMDMTYFAISSPSLKKRELKIAIVFNYEAFRFEAWLAGKNRKVNRHYRELFKDKTCSDYRIVEPAKGVDSIIERDITQSFDLNDQEALTLKIETDTNLFIEYIEGVLKEMDV